MLTQLLATKSSFGFNHYRSWSGSVSFVMNKMVASFDRCQPRRFFPPWARQISLLILFLYPCFGTSYCINKYIPNLHFAEVEETCREYFFHFQCEMVHSLIIWSSFVVQERQWIIYSYILLTLNFFFLNVLLQLSIWCSWRYSDKRWVWWTVLKIV